MQVLVILTGLLWQIGHLKLYIALHAGYFEKNNNGGKII